MVNDPKAKPSENDEIIEDSLFFGEVESDNIERTEQ